MKILEVVKINNRFGFVVDEAAPLVYREQLVYDRTFKRHERMLIGESPDGRMDFLTYRNWGSMKAFAGRELTIQMEDGTQRTIKDVWWSEGATRYEEANGVRMSDFSYNTLSGCIDCCVFYAGIMHEERLQELINEFYETHPSYSPWDHDAWHDHCRKLHEEQYMICPKCHTSVHQDKAPYGECPRCSSKMITLEEHYKRLIADARKEKNQ